MTLILFAGFLICALTTLVLFEAVQYLRRQQGVREHPRRPHAKKTILMALNVCADLRLLRSIWISPWSPLPPRSSCVRCVSYPSCFGISPRNSYL